MKTLLCPYGANSGNWISAYALYNHENEDVEIEITLTSSDGKTSKKILKKINANGIGILAPNEIKDLIDGRHSIIFKGPDELFVTPLLTHTANNGAVGFGTLPVHELTTIKN